MLSNYNWEREFQYISNSSNKSTPISIGAIKSCIEADEPIHLSHLLNNNQNAKIYALICCFSLIPSIKCIEYLISVDTPLDKTFDNNPFTCTPQDYSDKYFNIKYINKLHTNTLSSIYTAIENGRKKLK